MSKFIEPNILFQYKSTTKLKGLLDGLLENAISVSNETLFDFFNLDEARGAWLDQLGAYLNIPRPFLAVANAFILDSSVMDGPDLMDGEGAFVSDYVYISYIKGIIYKRNSRFTINDIINCLLYVTGPSKIFINSTVKTVDIYIGVPTEEQKRMLLLLEGFNPKWFGLPTGVRLASFTVVVLPPDTDFFILDSSLMDDPQFLMV